MGAKQHSIKHETKKYHNTLINIVNDQDVDCFSGFSLHFRECIIDFVKTLHVVIDVSTETNNYDVQQPQHDVGL